MSYDISLYGFTGLVGRTVSVWLAGLDCGDTTVFPDGSVGVNFKSDPDGLLTIPFLLSLNGLEDWGPLSLVMTVNLGAVTTNITIPAVVGFTYTSQGQVVRPLLEGEVKSPQGSGLGKLRRSHQFGVLVDSSVALTVSYGTTFTNLYPAEYRAADGTLLNHNTLFNGVFWNTLSDDYSYDGAFCWQVTRPYPHNMVSLSGIMETNEG